MTTGPICYAYRNKEELIGFLRNGANRGLPSGPVITATKNMAANLWPYRKHNGMTVHISKILRTLLPAWYDRAAALEEVIQLGDLINDPALCVTAEEQRALNANRLDIWSSIRTLVEMGISPDMLSEDYQGVTLFLKIYRKVWHDDAIVRGFRQMMARWKNSSSFFHIISDLEIEIQQEKYRLFNHMEAVYFQGFYDIMPVQARLLDAFCSLGIPVYFLNNFDDVIPEAYEIWKTNPYFRAFEKMKCDALGNNTERHYVKMFSNRPVEDNKDNRVAIHEFSNVFSFARQLSQPLAEKRIRLYTPGRRDLQDFMDTFFPDCMEKKHFLAYPIGQYLYQLYQMWDPESDALRFDVDGIRKCLATGWAGRYVSTNTDEMMTCFNKCAVYFEDCHTLEEWRHHIRLLRDVRENISPLFDTIPPDSDYKRWHRIMGNPLDMVGPFSIDEEELGELTNLLDDILKDARSLFQQTGRINLVNHFHKVEALLKDKEAYLHMAEEEKDAASEIFKRLNQRPRYIESCTTDSLTEAMQFFLGGKLKDDADLGEADEDDGPISTYADLEDAQYRNQCAMICFCDDMHMPGTKGEYPWPLSEQILTHLREENEEVMHLRAVYIHYKEKSCMENRYLFHLALQLPNVIFSWIDKFNNQEMTVSPYLKILSMKPEYRVPIDQPEKEDAVIFDMSASLQVPSIEPQDFEIQDIPSLSGIQEIEINRDKCSWRNLYDFILEDHPVFTSKFQLQFWVTRFIAMIGRQGGHRPEEIADYVMRILPLWNRTEQKEKLAFAKKLRPHLKDLDTSGRDTFDNRGYLKERLNLKYLDINPNPCFYCPHREACYFAKRGDNDENIE